MRYVGGSSQDVDTSQSLANVTGNSNDQSPVRILVVVDQDFAVDLNQRVLAAAEPSVFYNDSVVLGQLFRFAEQPGQPLDSDRIYVLVDLCADWLTGCRPGADGH